MPLDAKRQGYFLQCTGIIAYLLAISMVLAALPNPGLNGILQKESAIRRAITMKTCNIAAISREKCKKSYRIVWNEQ
jgi:hypothetical protein